MVHAGTSHPCVTLHRYGYPALVALTPEDAKFAPLRSAFQPAQLADFVEDLRQARQRLLD